MQRLEVSGAVRPIYGSLGVKRLGSRERTGSAIVTHKFLGAFAKLSFCLSVRLSARKNSAPTGRIFT